MQTAADERIWANLNGFEVLTYQYLMQRNLGPPSAFVRDKVSNCICTLTFSWGTQKVFLLTRTEIETRNSNDECLESEGIIPPLLSPAYIYNASHLTSRKRKMSWPAILTITSWQKSYTKVFLTNMMNDKFNSPKNPGVLGTATCSVNSTAVPCAANSIQEERMECYFAIKRKYGAYCGVIIPERNPLE